MEANRSRKASLTDPNEPFLRLQYAYQYAHKPPINDPIPYLHPTIELRADGISIDSECNHAILHTA
jgi:hypothetical protein